jgi:outer membrane receptor protein involved in Fe transport
VNAFRRPWNIVAVALATLGLPCVGLAGDVVFQLLDEPPAQPGWPVVFIRNMQVEEQPFQTDNALVGTYAGPLDVMSPFGGPPGDGASLSPAARKPGGENFLGLPSIHVTGGSQAITRDARDTGSLLFESPQTTAVSLFRRPAATNLQIRGFGSPMLQTQLNGQMWYQTRPDQDTIVSKIDSGIVSNVVVIPGPYSALYGPGAAFIDIMTAPTMRSGCDCTVSSYRSVLNYDTNGQGYYARQAVNLGGANYGVRGNVGFRHMDDYTAGNGAKFNSSFTYRDIDLAFSRDFADDSTFDFQYLRNDITDAEFYGQPYNMNFGVTNGFLGRYQTQSLGLADHLLLEAWYNQTQLGQGAGTTLAFTNPANNTNLLFAPAQQSYGNTYGARSIATYGDADSESTKLGVDFRGIKNRITEQDTLPQFAAPNTFTRVVPNSDWLNPGLLAQREIKEEDQYAVRYGGRVDFVQTNVGPYPSSPPFAVPATDRNFTLLSAFAALETQLDDVWKATTSLGHGQRAPTLFQLYADRVFVAGYQHGFTTQQGNPNLLEERVSQVDFQVDGEFADARLMGRAFYAYVDNYVTVQWAPNVLVNGFPPQIVNGYQFVNSDSSFAGVEFNSEYNVRSDVSVFANGSYTQGQDVGQFGGPVFGIYPFQSRVGVRLERGDQERGYGVELAARLVAAQTRVADGNRGLVAPFEQEQTTAAFQTLDIRSYLRLTRSMLVTLGVTNLANQAYQEHFDYHSGVGTPQNPSGQVLQLGRNFYFGMERNY